MYSFYKKRYQRHFDTTNSMILLKLQIQIQFIYGIFVCGCALEKEEFTGERERERKSDEKYIENFICKCDSINSKVENVSNHSQALNNSNYREIRVEKFVFISFFFFLHFVYSIKSKK